MNIKDFLIENYIWILVIILITIITIIGFLADKKKSNKKSDIESKPNPSVEEGQTETNAQPIQYNGQEQYTQNQMNNNGIDMNLNNFNNQEQQENPINNMTNMSNINTNINNVNSMNNNMGTEQMSTTIPMGVTSMNNPSPIDNITPNVNTEPMYQPLSEQKQIISPRPVSNFPNPQNSNINNMDNNLNFNNPNINTQMAKPNFMPNNNINSDTAFNNIQKPMSSPMNNNQMNNNNLNMQNYVLNNRATQEPLNTIPRPQPVKPQPIMQGMYNNGPIPQQSNYNQQMGPSNLNQQPNQMGNQPINFVYGPQNNNQNM